MQEEHQQLVNQYREGEGLRDSFTRKTIALEMFVVAIVCGMKVLQATASLGLNAIATTCVAILLLWHFWDFKDKRAIDRELTDIVLEGVALERRFPFLKPAFFRDYMQKFNVIGNIAITAIFDFIFLYFFSVSVTQLFKCINPEIVAKLMSSAKIRTAIISTFLIWTYYRPLRPLVRLKKELR